MIDHKLTQNCLGGIVNLLRIPLQKFIPKSLLSLLYQGVVNSLIAWTCIFC